MTATNGADLFFEWISNIIQNANIFTPHTNYIVILFMVLATCIVITPRKPSNIKILALPVMIGYVSLGLKIPLLFIGIASIVFIMETMSLQAIGNIAGAMSQRVAEIGNIKEHYSKENKLRRSLEKNKLERKSRLAEELGIKEQISGMVKIGEKRKKERQQAEFIKDTETEKWADNFIKSMKSNISDKDEQIIRTKKLRRKKGFMKASPDEKIKMKLIYGDDM